MTMLVWGSRYRWTLASTLLYVGLAGWAIGGTGAVIDSIIPINFRLHNTVWVVAHFHTYLMLTVVVWVLAFLAHLLERDAGVTSSQARAHLDDRAAARRRLRPDRHLVRRGRARRPAPLRDPAAGTSGYSLVGSIFALLFALGVLACVAQLVSLGRTAWARRHYVLVDHVDSWTGTHYEARVARRQHRAAGGRGARPGRPGTCRSRAPSSSASAPRPASSRSPSFFPQIVDGLRGEHPLPPPRPRRPLLPRTDGRSAARVAARRVATARRPLRRSGSRP